MVADPVMTCFLLALVGFWCIATGAASQFSPAITTTSGVIQGQLVQSGNDDLDVYEFLGVPFAEPPIGKRRFAFPVPKANSPGVLMANKEPSACPQLFGAIFPQEAGDIFMPVQDISEDCLYLNIWAPRTAIDKLYASKGMRGAIQPDSPVFKSSTSSLSVMVWIHGGGFYSGSSMLPMYNGSILAAFNDIIVVSIQYRLGALGFLYLDQDDAPGNLGLWDQLEALKWIKNNIGTFGGNYRKVTIFGEGSGAVSVSYHLLSPYSTGYFERAIIQSGTANSPWAYVTQAESLKRSNDLANAIINNFCKNLQSDATTADKLACLRKVNYYEILKYQDSILKPDSNGSFGFMQIPFVPVVDGVFVPRDPPTMLAEGQLNDVPVLMGSNLNESSLFMTFSPKALHAFPTPLHPHKSARSLTSKDFSAFIQEYFAFYPRIPTKTDPLLLRFIEMHYSKCDAVLEGVKVLDALGSATGDYSITCPMWSWASAQSNVSNSTFMYQFTHRPSTEFWPSWMGVIQGDELPFVFGFPFTFMGQKFLSYTAAEKMLSRKIMTFWSNFAKYGDPNQNDSGSPNGRLLPLAMWPIYESSKRVVLEINGVKTANANSTIRDFKTSDCVFWSELITSLQNLIDKSGSGGS